MSNILELEITQKHIDNAGVGAFSCPIALALTCKFIGYYAIVSLDHARIVKYNSRDFDKEIKEYLLDLETQKFIINYDEGEEVKPGIYNLIEKT